MLGNGPFVTVYRERLDGLANFDLDFALASDPGLTETLRLAIARTSAMAEANKLLDPIWEMSAMPSREQFAALRQWSPLLEQMAYKCGARLSILLDLLRPQVRKNLTGDAAYADPQLHVYWSSLHIMAHLILFASEAEARPWLSDVASQFRWRTWTPTFPLLRERTVWLAACAARSAIAFGEPVVGKYLEALSAATHPMKAFDALFGLVAIALAHPAAAIPVLSELRSLRAIHVDHRTAYSDYFELEYDDAIRTISRPELIKQDADVEIPGLGWRPQSQQGLATRAALRTDPARFSASRRFVGFSILPTVISTVPDSYYPTAAAPRGELDLSRREIADIIRRTWVPNSPDPASRTLQ